MLAVLRLALLEAVITGALAAGCSSTVPANESCAVSASGVLPETLASEGSCPAGSTCASDLDGEYVCQVLQACDVDSNCPRNFGCSLLAAWGGTKYCATSCADNGTSYGCAAGSACAEDGTCQSRTGESCYVTDTVNGVYGSPCGVGAACSAVSGACAVSSACEDASACGGYACVNSNCALSCTSDTVDTASEGGVIAGCAPGFTCDLETFLCSATLGRPCDPASNDANQCGAGGACSATARTCEAATPCVDDNVCGGYGCLNGYCAMSCTAKMSPCAVGSTCDLASNTCF